MAEKKQSSPVSPVVSYQDGYGLVSRLESDKLSAMLQEYMGRVDAYKIDEYDNRYQVTVKIVFQPGENINNVKLWSWLIVKALHTSLYKEQTTVYPSSEAMTAYVEWTIWKGIKRIASKRQSNTGF